MPRRKTVFAVNETYHIFNRSVARSPIFINQRDYKRAISLINFYSFPNPPLRFSHFNRLTPENKLSFFSSLSKNQERQVSVLSFCLMPNHFHFLLTEKIADGITNFLRNLQNSYAKYFNTKYDRSGAVFQEQFKAKRIETDQQLLHISRYIHLNPTTSYLIEKPEDLAKYEWSSYPDFLGITARAFVNKTFLKNFGSPEAFKKFTLDQIDYQKQIKHLEHLVLE